MNTRYKLHFVLKEQFYFAINACLLQIYRLDVIFELFCLGYQYYPLRGNKLRMSGQCGLYIKLCVS